MSRHTKETELAVRRWLRDRDQWLYGRGITAKRAARMCREMLAAPITADYLRSVRALEPGLCWRGRKKRLKGARSGLTSAQWSLLLGWLHRAAVDHELNPSADAVMAMTRRIHEAGIGVRPSVQAVAEGVRLTLLRKARQHAY